MATTPYPFVAGAVLTASQLNSTFNVVVNNQTDSYTLLASDGGKRVVMNKATATTITVNDSLFGAGDSVWIHNIGAGVCTITAGTATVNTAATLALAQWEGGQLYFTSASTAIFFRGGSKQTLNVDFFLAGGGGGGGRFGATLSGGGGGAGGFVTGSGIIGKTTYAVTVGAGGAGATDDAQVGKQGTASSFIKAANGGGGGGGSTGGGQNGASGGGAGRLGAGGAGISGEGNAGGTGDTANATGGGGGGGAGGTGGNFATATVGAAGGAASTNNYDGVSTSYSGGGGGGGTVTGGTAGTNAGNGGSNGVGANATANRGGGGGGGGKGDGGNGGSGRVIVRWLTADATGLSISVTGTTTNGTDGSYTWYSWTATGTLVVA